MCWTCVGPRSFTFHTTNKLHQSWPIVIPKTMSSCFQYCGFGANLKVCVWLETFHIMYRTCQQNPTCETGFRYNHSIIWCKFTFHLYTYIWGKGDRDGVRKWLEKDVTWFVPEPGGPLPLQYMLLDCGWQNWHFSLISALSGLTRTFPNSPKLLKGGLRILLVYNQIQSSHENRR